MRRMYKDIKQFQAANLEAEGIFCSFNEDDLFDVKAMVVGPKDTPYEDGFYFFRLTFPKNYPFAPPKAVFETRHNTGGAKLRFNPNLYANGKVCVSILGTWSGPQWEPCQSLYSILLAFQTLLVEEPLTNEPGFEKVTPSLSDRHNKYRTMVAFENYRVAILRMMEHPPDGFEAFVPIMQQWTYQRAAAIHARLREAAKAEPLPKPLRCSVYTAFKTVVDYPRIYAEFGQIWTQLKEVYGTLSTPSGEDHTIEEGVHVDTGPCPEETSVQEATSAHAASHGTGAPSVGAEVDAAVTAFAQASIADTPTATVPSAKSKRKRPDVKAHSRRYDIVEVAQANGQTLSFQSVPSEYTRAGKAGEPPTKRTRWLWRRLDDTHPPIPAPSSTGTTEAVVL